VKPQRKNSNTLTEEETNKSQKKATLNENKRDSTELHKRKITETRYDHSLIMCCTVDFNGVPTQTNFFFICSTHDLEKSSFTVPRRLITDFDRMHTKR